MRYSVQLAMILSALFTGCAAPSGDTPSDEDGASDDGTSDTDTTDTHTHTDDTDSSTDCPATAATVTDLSFDDLIAMLDDRDNGLDQFEMINVHVPHSEDIEGTDTDITYQDVDAIEAYLSEDPTAKAVLYCKTGPMSAIATQELADRGYCNIYDLPDGYTAWKSAGHPMAD